MVGGFNLLICIIAIILAAVALDRTRDNNPDINVSRSGGALTQRNMRKGNCLGKCAFLYTTKASTCFTTVLKRHQFIAIYLWNIFISLLVLAYLAQKPNKNIPEINWGLPLKIHGFQVLLY